MNFFPFEEVREEQNKLIEDIEAAIDEKKSIIAHAPTGLGKTAASLAPVLDYAIKKDLDIFFLTSRNSQHKLVIETLQKIHEKTNNINAVDFVEKKHMCPKMLDYDQRSLNFFEFCVDLKKNKRCDLFNNCVDKNNHSKKAVDFAHSLLSEGPITVEEVVQLTKDKFCAYEISLLMAQKARVVVADYFHIFDPEIQKILFNKINKKLSKTIIIVDEAHNLPDRIRNDWTMKLNTFILRDIAEYFKDEENAEMEDLITSLKERLTSYSKEKLGKENEVLISKEEIVSLVEEVTGKKYSHFTEEFADAIDEIEDREENDAFFKLYIFLKYWERATEGFVRILRKEKTSSGKPFPSVEYCCLDPSVVSGRIFEKAYCSILMSGTLLPGQMYRDVLGFDSGQTEIKKYNNPFPRKNKLVMVSKDITTKYESRTEEMYKKIATSCAYIANSVDGNSALFFSSYGLMSNVMQYLEPILSKELFMEERGMSKKDKEDLINNFKNGILKGGAVLAGVQGASFSEGVDLPGDYLKGVAIIGVPLAPPDLRQKALIKYYDKKFNKGWDYGYVFPAVNKALQAAGRCIRSETDTGIIAFLDKRFLWSKYRKIIPPDWNMQVTDDFGKEIKDFLKK